VLAVLFVALSQLLGAASAGARVPVEPTSFVFSAIAYSVGEAAGPATITITRSGSLARSASIRFTTAHGTATAGSDYTEVRRYVAFASGQSTGTVTVPIVNDADAEGDETVQLALSNPSAGTGLGYPSAAVLTILDDEKAFSFAWATYFVSEHDGMAFIAIDRVGSSSGIDSVHFATADDTAKAGVDYVATSRLVSFARGESTKMVSVPILNDSAVDGSKILQMALSSPSAGIAVIDPRSAPLTIFDDDAVRAVKPKPSGRVAAARFTKKSFTSAQATVVKLVYSFSPRSERFAYLLSFRQDSRWKTLRRVSKKGVFAGSYKMTVKQLFGPKAVVPGQYRLKLSADKNSKLLGFSVR
jgi:hypothetical protein